MKRSLSLCLGVPGLPEDEANTRDVFAGETGFELFQIVGLDIPGVDRGGGPKATRQADGVVALSRSDVCHPEARLDAKAVNDPFGLSVTVPGCLIRVA